jgi:hypothetical protein
MVSTWTSIFVLLIIVNYLKNDLSTNERQIRLFLFRGEGTSGTLRGQIIPLFCCFARFFLTTYFVVVEVDF